MIPTILITVVLEGLIVIGFCARYNKPLLPILGTSGLGNVVTQWLLWTVLQTFFQHYLAALLVTEILIWFLEGLLLYLIPWNQLKWTESMLLSMAMNLSSFAIGWFLPV